MGDLRRGERGNILVPAARQRSDNVGILEVDEVVGCLRGVQLRLGRRPPAIGLRPEIFDLVDRFGASQKGGHVRREAFGSEAVDHPMASVAPSERRRDGEQRKEGESCEAAEVSRRIPLHAGSIPGRVGNGAAEGLLSVNLRLENSSTNTAKAGVGRGYLRRPRLNSKIADDLSAKGVETASLRHLSGFGPSLCCQENALDKRFLLWRNIHHSGYYLSINFVNRSCCRKFVPGVLL